MCDCMKKVSDELHTPGNQHQNVLLSVLRGETGMTIDKRKKRRAHRKAAKNLLKNGGLFNGFSAPGSTFFCIAQWHLKQSRV